MFEGITPESIRQEMTARAGLDIDVREGSFVGDMLSTAAYEIWKVYQSLNAMIPIAFVDETSGEYIDKRCAEYGIVRKPGTKARAEVAFTGEDGAVIPQGAVLLTPTGLEFLTLEEAVVDQGEASVQAEAAEIGAQYNVEAGAINALLAAVAGVQSVAGGKAAGGTDVESDKDLVERLHQRLQNPATSGNATHYQQWAMEVPGVGGAKVIPLSEGPGTVKVLIVDQERKPAAEAITQECLAHIETQRPIGATVSVASAQGLEVNIAATVTLESSVTLENVTEKFQKALADYLNQIAFVKYDILYNRVAFILLDIDGVVDYTALTVNGGTENVTIGADQVPVLGTVTIDAA